MLMTLSENDRMSSIRNIAIALLERAESQIEYYDAG